ncbi:hypothetical protein FHETE_11195 [Fusarium heterosporum]|uniref:Uncharacterized protein n=1 Tax=Fusarium heterosporum TaxID=42747 RepID=A0A8H5SPE3_FUSHE|nr:hypothetical protein FHETE_11195 [Fusarium heterosporum]
MPTLSSPPILPPITIRDSYQVLRTEYQKQQVEHTRVHEMEQSSLRGDFDALLQRNRSSDTLIEALQAHIASYEEQNRDLQVRLQACEERLESSEEANRRLQVCLQVCEEENRRSDACHWSAENDLQDSLDDKRGLHARLRAEESLLQGSSAETQQSEDALPW